MGSSAGTTSTTFMRYIGSLMLIVAYLALNSALNLTNKWCLAWFAFPLVLTASHMIIGFSLLLPFIFRPDARLRNLQALTKQWKGICCIGVFLGLNIALNNMALADMTLSLNQVIRALIPVFTCLITSCLKSQVPGADEVGSLIILSGGVMITMWTGQASGSSRAILYCLAGTVCNAAMMGISEKVLSEKIEILTMTCYTGPVSFLTVLPALVMKEWQGFIEFQALNKQATIRILLSTSILALAYNMIHSLVIRHFSAVTITVVGEAKVVGLLLLAATLLDEQSTFTPSMTVGAAIALLGFVMYSQVKIRAHGSAKEVTPAKMGNDPGISLAGEKV